MRGQVAWPESRDLLPGGALFPFVARCGAGAVTATALLSLTQSPLLLTLAALLAYALTPPRLGAYTQPPATLNPGSFCTQASQRAPWAQLNLVLLLGAAAGPAQNLLLLLCFAPLVAYSLGSTLWTELDLRTGQLFYHRMFFGLQISRAGSHLEDGVAVHSALPRGDRFLVAIALKSGGHIPVRSDTPTAEASRDFGRRLARQLDLPHVVADKPEDEWPSLPVQQQRAQTSLPWADA